MGMTTVHALRSASASSLASRWWQLVFGIVCMVMTANLQYGWTLFVNPIDQKYHWGRAAIQVAFTIFVLTETWLVPIEGYLIDKFGPRIMISGSGVLVAIAWVINSLADSLLLLYLGAAIGGIGAGVIYGGSVGNALKWFPFRRRLGADRDPDRQHDPVERLRDRLPLVRSWTGHRRGSGGAPIAGAAAG